jgi:4-amino-4-deoxy-L-arabinose transferase-like glycosyltransferase
LESFSALILAFMAAGFLFRWRGVEGSQTGLKGSFVLGLALGLAFHLQPVFLPVALGYMAFELWWWRRERRWRPLGMVALGMVLACLPWGIRNYANFQQVFFVRSNLGLELYVGNHDGAHADIDVSAARGSFRHPRTDRSEAERVLDLGEGPYMSEKLKEALNWISENPGEFLRLTGTRFLYFWVGPLHEPSRAWPYLLLTLLALGGAWRILPHLDSFQRAALLIPLCTFPLIYYVVAYMPRYGEPVRWILMLFAAAAIVGKGTHSSTGRHSYGS